MKCWHTTNYSPITLQGAPSNSMLMPTLMSLLVKAKIPEHKKGKKRRTN